MARPSRWNEIVDAAATLFREKGFVATSLEDIAREVGMYKGSLYHYIKSKEDLLFAVVREPAERILADVRELEQPRPAAVGEDPPHHPLARPRARGQLHLLLGVPRRGGRAAPLRRVVGDGPRVRPGRDRGDRGRPAARRVRPLARPAHDDAGADRLAQLADPLVLARGLAPRRRHRRPLLRHVPHRAVERATTSPTADPGAGRRARLVAPLPVGAS